MKSSAGTNTKSVMDKYKVAGQIRYGDWDKSDIKGFGQLVLTALLQVSTASRERRLLIPVRVGFKMIHLRMIHLRKIHVVRMIHLRVRILSRLELGTEEFHFYQK